MLSRDHPRRCGDKQCLSFLLIRKQDHPLECGDKPTENEVQAVNEGSPPRMRGQGCQHIPAGHGFGITPADAGTRREILK